VQDYWGSAPPELEASFYGSPLLRAYLYECAAGRPPDGDPGPGWAERLVVDRYLADQLPFRNCLSLCCGFGELERTLGRWGVFEACVGMDVSPGALAGARKAAEAEGLPIEYVQADLNTAAHAPESFDVVWANGAFHHLERLEHAIEQAHGALRPGGWLVANEYVGPPRQDFPVRQRELINALVHAVPERLRYAREDRFLPPRLRHRPRGVGGAYLRVRRLAPGRGFRFGKVWDRDRRHFEHIDPTEGVRSDEILPLLRAAFGEVHVHPYNGALLPHVLERRFYERYEEERDRPLLEVLIRAERALTALGEVGVDHAILVARRG
jgi:SAM-dependent methyltransferase